MSSLRSIVMNDFETIKSQRPRFSLRSYAKHIKVNPTTLSLFLRGKRELSHDTYCKIASRLNLPLDTKVGRRKKAFTELSNEKTNAVGDWYHFAILSLAEIKGFDASPTWIAARLNISPQTATEAVERLIRLGMLYRSQNNTVSLTGQNFFIASRKAHSQTLDLAKKSIEMDPLDKRNISSMTMAIDTAKLATATKRIQKFRRRLCSYLESGEKKEVYHISVQLFPMSRPV